MALSPDVLADRLRLKNENKRWRVLALVFLFVGIGIAVLGVSSSGISGVNQKHIARITISGIIEDDVKRDEMLADLASDKHVKAVLVRLDSPGGTTVGGEELYRQLRAISKEKPVIGVMRTLCTSACYMASLGTTHSIARASSLTGSIGVIMEMAEITELAKNIGINPITVKSGSLKASPSLTEKFTESERAYLQGVIDDSFAQFVALVTKNRKLSDTQLLLIKDGRVVTGKQALALNLIDDLGGENDALAWLSDKAPATKKLPILDVEPEKDIDDWLATLEQSAGKIIFGALHQRLDGVSAIWQPVIK